MRRLLGWTLALACPLSLMSLAGCGNKGVDLPNMGQTVPFVKGKDSEGAPAGGPGGGSAGTSKTGLKKWQGGSGTAPAAATPPPK